jgi:hypothetical protein
MLGLVAGEFVAVIGSNHARLALLIDPELSRSYVEFHPFDFAAVW